MRIVVGSCHASFDVKEFLRHALKGRGTGKSMGIEAHWRDIQSQETSS